MPSPRRHTPGVRTPHPHHHAKAPAAHGHLGGDTLLLVVGALLGAALAILFQRVSARRTSETSGTPRVDDAESISMPAADGPYDRATPVVPLVFEANPRAIPSFLIQSLTRRAHAGMALDWGFVPSMKNVVVYASSVRGQSHRYDERGRDGEDAYGISWTKDRLILAVADGVSTSPGSGVAAEKAVRVTLQDLFGRALPSGRADWSALFTNVAAALAGDHPGGHTTLTIATVTLDGRFVTSIARVGDSPAMLHTGSNLDELFPAKPKDAVDVLPLHPDRFDVARTRLPRGGGLLLCSDGLGDVLIGPEGAATRVAFASRWKRPLANPLSFARDLDYELVGRFDDKTAVMVWLQ